MTNSVKAIMQTACSHPITKHRCLQVPFSKALHLGQARRAIAAGPHLVRPGGRHWLQRRAAWRRRPRAAPQRLQLKRRRSCGGRGGRRCRLSVLQARLRGLDRLHGPLHRRE